MKLADLREVKHPKPAEPKACLACKAFIAECVVPVGEGSAPMCWLCAHQVVDHNVPLHEACTAECECTPDQVYPVRVYQAQQRPVLRFEHGDSMKMQHPDDWKTGHYFNTLTGDMETNVRGEIIATHPLTERAVEREELLHAPEKDLVAWAREAHKQMSEAQLAAVKKRLAKKC